MGIITDYMDRVEPALLEYGQQLGGNPDSLKDLPFSEEADKDGMPEELYVRHDQAVIHDTAVSLMNGLHVGLISSYGTGKTALREIVRRDLGGSERFTLAYLENADNTTPRGLYATVVRAAIADGYELDSAEYNQLRNGVPWVTDEAKSAVREIVERAEADGKTVVLLVDEIEDFPEELLPTLQTTGDVGVRLFLLGTESGKERLERVRDTLDSRVKWHEGIKPFEVKDVKEYIARSMAYFRGDEFSKEYSPVPFTDGAIHKIHEQTNGNPRKIRLECSDALAKGAIAWSRSRKDVENFQVDERIVTSKIKG